jgi:hypothetical protein
MGEKSPENTCKQSSRDWPRRTARFSPQSQRGLWHRRRRPLRLRTGLGEVELRVWHGQDPADRHWGCPRQERWGLGPHPKITPGLADKLCFTVTATGSYEEAAAVAAKWGCPVDDSTLHALVQRVGARAEGQTQERLAHPPRDMEPRRKPSALAVLLLDGWLARFRGPGWGRKKPSQPRVEWHELKTGVFYRQEQAARTASGRGVLSDKVIVSWQGEPGELGRRLHGEALRRGLARAEQTLVLGDGSAWIWNVKTDRWKTAWELLDFYHGSQHLWQLGRALQGEAQAGAWVEPRLHQMRHGEEKKVLEEIGRLQPPKGEAGPAVRQEQGYFAGQAGRMSYQEIARRGWPIGSGAVESACRQKQGRFKRPGQFSTADGLRHLGALDEARRNGHWHELWPHP